jgi:hypothetical protein
MEFMSANKPILCVDFDGVIHSYKSGWMGVDVIPDAPVPGALRWLWEATRWFNVQIYSSRSKEPKGRQAMKEWMIAHSTEELGEKHPMAQPVEDEDYPIGFCHEKPAAFLTIDDRAIQFQGRWDEVDPEELRGFKPWNKR